MCERLKIPQEVNIYEVLVHTVYLYLNTYTLHGDVNKILTPLNMSINIPSIIYFAAPRTGVKQGTYSPL